MTRKAFIRYGIGFVALVISTYLLTLLTVAVYNSGKPERIGFPDSIFQPPATSLIFAHRGLTENTTENTIDSFRKAAELGSDVLETDVQMTKDGTVVLFHDPDLMRLASRPETVAQLTLDELRAIKIPAGCKENCQTIATLQELLDTFPEHPTNVEIKVNDRTLARKVAELLAHRQDRKDVIVGSAHSEAIEEFRRHSSLPSSAYTTEVIHASICYLLDARCSFSFQALQLPYRKNSILPALRAEPEFLEYARNRGLRTHYWTINETSDMQALLDRNVDGIMTDFPGRAVKLKRSRQEAATDRDARQEQPVDNGAPGP